MNYTLKKISNPASVYPPPAYKVFVGGEEIGTAYRVTGNQWKFEAAAIGFTSFGRSIKEAIGYYISYNNKECE